MQFLGKRVARLAGLEPATQGLGILSNRILGSWEKSDFPHIFRIFPLSTVSQI